MQAWEHRASLVYNILSVYWQERISSYTNNSSALNWKSTHVFESHIKRVISADIDRHKESFFVISNFVSGGRKLLHRCLYITSCYILHIAAYISIKIFTCQHVQYLPNKKALFADPNGYLYYMMWNTGLFLYNKPWHMSVTWFIIVCSLALLEILVQFLIVTDLYF